MTGMSGNQERMTLNPASIIPETIPADEVLIPPDAKTLDNAFMTFDASEKRKT